MATGAGVRTRTGLLTIVAAACLGVACDPGVQAERVASPTETAPPETVGLFVIAREGKSTCRSVRDVVGVEVPAPNAAPATIDANAVVLLDPDGKFLQPCPGPSGAHAYTAFVVAIPERYADRLGGVVAEPAPREG